ITFDCYGTLIDWQRGIAAYVEPILRRLSKEQIAFSDWFARWEQDQFKLLEPWSPYREILQRSYASTMRNFVLASFEDEGNGLARSVADWPPFADTTKGLRRLARRFRLGIIANID